MISKRYAALSLIPLATLLLGFGALAAPASFRGPLIAAQTPGLALTLGLEFPAQPIYFAHAVGLILLVLAVSEVWIIAITWEYRRHRRG